MECGFAGIHSMTLTTEDWNWNPRMKLRGEFRSWLSIMHLSHQGRRLTLPTSPNTSRFGATTSLS